MLFSKCVLGTSLITQLVKNLPAMQESACDAGDPGSIPGSGRSPNGYFIFDKRGKNVQ